MNGGGLVVPKRTSCEVALLPAVQLRLAVMLTPVAPLAGFGALAAPGSGSVVKLHTVPVVVPELFFSSIRQKYVVPADSVPGLYVVPVWFWMNGGGLVVPKRTSCEVAPL